MVVRMGDVCDGPGRLPSFRNGLEVRAHVAFGVEFNFDLVSVEFTIDAVQFSKAKVLSA